jgi:integrase
MHEQVSHGARSRERIAPNVYRRTTKSGAVVFEVMFRDVDGRQRARRLNATSERAAIREARATLAERDNGERIVAAGITVDEFAQQDYFPMLAGLVAAGRRAERGLDRYRYDYTRYVKPRLGEKRLGEIEPRHLSDLIRAMRQAGFAESSIHNALMPLRGLYRLARSRGLAGRSPFDGLDSSEVPRPSPPPAARVLDELELAALVRHATGGYRAAVTLLAYTGLRVSEVLGLRWADVDFVEGELHVRSQLLPARKDRPPRLAALKTRASERDVPLFPAVENALAELLERELGTGRGQEADLVFVTRSGKPLSARNVARAVEDAAASAGLQRATPHDLRRSFCSLAGRRGVDPIEAAQITGHSPTVWARFYARSFGKAQRAEARRRMLEHGFGAVPREEPEGPLTQR